MRGSLRLGVINGLLDEAGEGGSGPQARKLELLGAGLQRYRLHFACDLDLDLGTLLLRRVKRGQSRVVPLPPAALPHLARYYPGELHAFHAFIWRTQARQCWADWFEFAEPFRQPAPAP